MVRRSFHDEFFKSFFSLELKLKKGKELWRSLTHDHNHVRRCYEYNVLMGGSVEQCVVDRIIFGWCDHSPFGMEGTRHSFIDDDDVRVLLEFLLSPTNHLWTSSPMSQLWQQSAHGFAFVFYIKQRESFDKLVNETKFLLQLKEKNGVPLILVGSDHGYCFEPAGESTRQVTVEEAENLAQVLGGRYFEMSAEEAVKNGDYIPFQYLSRQIRRLDPLSDS